MALIFMDGFDHYGTAPARLLDGVYSSYEGVTISAAAARTGPCGISVQVGQNDSGLRWPCPENKSVVGYGHTINLNRLPDGSNSAAITQILTANGGPLATVFVTPVGAVEARLGGRTGTVVATSLPEAVLPGSKQHFECEWNDGALEVRIDSVTVLNVPSVGYDGEIGQIMFGGCYGFPKTGATSVVYLIDDLFVRDDVVTETSKVNTWVGDQRVFMGLTDSDGTVVGWSASSGSDLWPMLDNIPPLDATEYIIASDVDDRAEVGFTNFPTNLIAITAVQLSTRVWKTDAGAAQVALGMKSGASEQMNVPHALSTAPRWFRDVYELNPATGLPWLLPDLNAASAVIERTE